MSARCRLLVVVDAMQIDANSINLNDGTVGFDRVGAPMVGLTQAKMLADKKVVLAVEGRLIRELLVTALKQAGSTSMIYGTAIEMAHKIVDYSPNIIFCEYSMESLNGVGFVRHVRRECKLKTPIVMLASRLDGDAQAKSIAAGANETVAIPFSVQDILGVTKRMLEWGMDRAPQKLFFGPR
jgi:DNA-binding response OmpR family regulator